MWLEKLREMKEGSGLTTKEIAEGSGLPEPTLEKIFAGTTKDPKLTTIQQLVHFLGYTLDDLDGTKKENTPGTTSAAPRATIDASRVETMLIQFGFIQPGQDLTDADLRFLISTGEIIRAWFEKGK